VSDAKYNVVPIAAEYTVDSGTLLLMHFDNNFIDSTGRHTPSPNWGATCSTTQFKYGDYSGYFTGLTDTSAGQHVSIPDSSDFRILGSALPKTFDFWMYPTNLPGVGQYMTLFSHRQDSTNGYYFWIYNNGGVFSFVFNTYANPSYTDIFEVTVSLSNNTWYHIALTLDAGTFIQADLYLNGTNIKHAHINPLAMAGSYSAPFKIGEQWIVGLSYLDFRGYIDEFRVSNVIRWTTTFDPAAQGTMNVYGKAKVNPFIFSRTDSYIIETGETYFRFYTNGAQVQA
jgi:hypothetical protein